VLSERCPNQERALSLLWTLAGAIVNGKDPHLSINFEALRQKAINARIPDIVANEKLLVSVYAPLERTAHRLVEEMRTSGKVTESALYVFYGLSKNSLLTGEVLNMEEFRMVTPKITV